jgi:hypothetical protein
LRETSRHVFGIEANMRQKRSSSFAADLDAGRIDMLRGQAKSRKRREPR